MGYNLTDKETDMVNEIQAKAHSDLKDRGIKGDYDSVLTTAIYGVTYFTRKLKLVKIR